MHLELRNKRQNYSLNLILWKRGLDVLLFFGKTSAESQFQMFRTNAWEYTRKEAGNAQVMINPRILNVCRKILTLQRRGSACRLEEGQIRCMQKKGAAAEPGWPKKRGLLFSNMGFASVVLQMKEFSFSSATHSGIQYTIRQQGDAFRGKTRKLLPEPGKNDCARAAGVPDYRTKSRQQCYLRMAEAILMVGSTPGPSILG